MEIENQSINRIFSNASNSFERITTRKKIHRTRLETRLLYISMRKFRIPIEWWQQIESELILVYFSISSQTWRNMRRMTMSMMMREEEKKKNENCLHKISIHIVKASCKCICDTEQHKFEFKWNLWSERWFKLLSQHSDENNIMLSSTQVALFIVFYCYLVSIQMNCMRAFTSIGTWNIGKWKLLWIREYFVWAGDGRCVESPTEDSNEVNRCTQERIEWWESTKKHKIIKRKKWE